MNEFERPELTEEEKAEVIKLFKDFGLGTNNGADLRIINPSEEIEDGNFLIVEDVEEEAPVKEKIAARNISDNMKIDIKDLFKIQETKDNDEIRKNLIKDELKFYKTIEYIDLDKLVEVDSSINFFAVPDNEEFLDLAASVEQFGIVNPLICTLDEASGNYIVLVGRSRIYALRSLYAESQDDRFFKVPCILLDSSTDPKLIQGLVISTNMKYRKLSKADIIKSVHILDDILFFTRKTRGEINVTDVIAKQAGVSRTTVNNYRELNKLCPKGMELIEKRHMNLGIARLISQKDQSTQEKIINGLGNDINDVKMVKKMMEEPMGRKTENWEEKAKSVKELIPSFTTVTIRVGFQEVEGFFKGISVLRKEYALKYATTKKNDINRFLKVSVNDRDMVQYINRGFLKQETLDKVLATEFNDVIKLA